VLTSADDRTWTFDPGAPLAPGLRAWALLGDGPRCETWLAWDTARWSPVAVKLPHPGELGRGRAEAVLARELEVARGLAHPGVQRLLGASLDADPPYLVFEYVEGPTLDHVLDEDGPMDEVDVLLVGLQLAAALHYLHGHGLVHLDVKPGNAVLRDGRAVLIDLGIARPVGAPPAPGRVRGTPPYMAPEQAARAPAAPSMDLFGLGAVLHELATDRRPTPRHRTAGPDEGPGTVVHRLLQADPADRPPTALAVLADLAGALPARLAEEDQPWPPWVDGLLAAADDCAERAMVEPSGR
jgi:serine/threonine protein kinase